MKIVREHINEGIYPLKNKFYVVYVHDHRSPDAEGYNLEIKEYDDATQLVAGKIEDLLAFITHYDLTYLKDNIQEYDPEKGLDYYDYLKEKQDEYDHQMYGDPQENF